MPDIPVWNKCDNKCVMCANTAAFCLNTSRDYSLLKQAARLERHLRGGAAYKKNARTAGAWNLTGGEPTLNPEFLKAVAHFRRRLKGAELLLLSRFRRRLRGRGAPAIHAGRLHPRPGRRRPRPGGRSQRRVPPDFARP